MKIGSKICTFKEKGAKKREEGDLIILAERESKRKGRVLKKNFLLRN